MRSLLICATPRSGSTLVAELLKATGIAGRPEEYFEDLRETGLPRQPRQYFETLSDPEVLGLLPETEYPHPERPGEFARRWEQILDRGRTPNGVWAGKLMWPHLLELGTRLDEVPGLEGTPLQEALPRALPDLRYLQVIRRDKVAQAVSLWKAVQTQEWRDGVGADKRREPEYRFAAVRHLVDQLTEQEAAWTRWLRHADPGPVVVVYEELVQDPRAGTERILEELGLPVSEARLPDQPPLRRQADDRSAAWAERYEADRADQEVPV